MNAARALPEGGSAGHEVRVTARSAGGKVLVEVHDSGAAIPPDHLQRLFEPYFSAAPGGAGLGLSVCQGVVTAAGGTVEVESASGRGTTFRVTLPALAATSAAALSTSAVHRSGGGSSSSMTIRSSGARWGGSSRARTR